MGRIQTFLGFVAITRPVMANPTAVSHTHGFYKIISFLLGAGSWSLIRQRGTEHIRVAHHCGVVLPVKGTAAELVPASPQ